MNLTEVAHDTSAELEELMNLTMDRRSILVGALGLAQQLVGEARLGTVQPSLAAVPLPWSDTLQGGATPSPADAVAAALAWLELIDNGQFEESWNRAAPLFKAAVERQRWAETIRRVREPLGRMMSRTQTSARATTSMPGGPDGAYVIVQFESEFEHKKSAVETVTPMLDERQVWRVSGYFIR
ncbi:MAG: DUF4019 domain-containing protein [Vicinamibacterales bacterium]